MLLPKQPTEFLASKGSTEACLHALDAIVKGDSSLCPILEPYLLPRNHFQNLLKPVCVDMALMQANQQGTAEMERTSARTNGFCLAGAVLMLPLRLHTAHSKSLSSAREARPALALTQA